jgi:hypothetical protein
MRALLLLVLASCAVRAPQLPAQHPASASAESGRLAGAPPALRPGVVEYKGLPAPEPQQPADHHHHH